MTTSFPSPILVGSDGSPTAHAAIDLAGQIVQATGASLHIAHVTLISAAIHPDTLSQGQFQRIQNEAQKRLDDEKAYAANLGITFDAAHLRFGRTDFEILSVAEDIGAGLIVIGNRSGQALARILLGNDAESIVRHAPCHVLVARA